MSLDYPFYEELCRRKHRAARWWLIGDRLYYLGLYSAILAFAGAGVAGGVVGILGLRGIGLHWFWAALGTFVGGAVVCFVGACLKGHAYSLAERDGISSAEVYRRGK